MRRREKFVLSSIVLSFGLFIVQHVSLDWKYLAVLVFSFFTYLISAWSLHDDLQKHEYLTIVPLPMLYAGAMGSFYFLLPDSIFSQVLNLLGFGVGMYALYLTANIFSVAKGRTIQLLHAAHAVGLFFTMLISLLFLNTIFSLKLDFYWNVLLIVLTHFPLSLLALWSVNLGDKISRESIDLSILLTFLLLQIGTIVSFLPLSVWNSALILMTVYYIGLGVLQNYIRSRLFSNTVAEYSVVAVLSLMIFLSMVPWK